MIYKCLNYNGLMSTAIRDIFKSLQSNHSYHTRLSNTSYLYSSANSVYFKSYVYDCVSVWNHIPIDIRNSQSLSSLRFIVNYLNCIFSKLESST